MDNCELAIAFLNACRTDRNLGDRTIKAYKGDLENFKSFLGERSMIKIKVDCIREYLTELKTRGLAGTSMKRKLATLKSFFSFLESEGLIEVSPTDKLKGRFRVARQLPKVMSPGEVSRILSVAKEQTKKEGGRPKSSYGTGLRNWLMMEILFSTGIRIDELVKLNVNDFDLERHSILIRGKGRKERLLFILNQEVLDLLIEYLSRRSSLAANTQALLLNKSLERLSVHSVGYIFSKLRDSAGLPKHFTPHCLRHTMATMLIENGADLRSVQEILGHSQVSTTERYVHVSKDRRQHVLREYNARDRLGIS